MSDANEEYIPALSYRFLTPFYDFIQEYIVRDVRYKSLLIERANIQPGQHVLDLGCGTGTLAIMAKQAQPAADVVGLDADPDMLKVAKYKSSQQNVSVKFDVGFTNKLPYPDESLDRVLSSIMIHHLKTPDKWQTAREVYRVLKPGGQLHIIDFGKPVTWYGKILSLWRSGIPARREAPQLKWLISNQAYLLINRLRMSLASSINLKVMLNSSPIWQSSDKPLRASLAKLPRWHKDY